jgi:ribosomal protein S18 acetylase RimI-like enzyme
MAYRKNLMVIPVKYQSSSLEIRPVTQEDLPAVLAVYQQCEDFLALGPVSEASMELVHKDLQISQDEGGVFCSIHQADGKIIGVIDYISHHYQGDPQTAYLSLLMIASPNRNQGIGEAVVQAFERQVIQDAQVSVIYAAVQVNNPRAARFWQRHGYRIVSEPRLHPDQTIAVDLRKEI